MPNKRDPSKKQLSFWVKKKELDRLEALAQKKGMTKTEFATYAIELALKLESKENENERNKDKK